LRGLTVELSQWGGVECEIVVLRRNLIVRFTEAGNKLLRLRSQILKVFPDICMQLLSVLPLSSVFIRLRKRSVIKAVQNVYFGGCGEWVPFRRMLSDYVPPWHLRSGALELV
jgi:hypothetical protein